MAVPQYPYPVVGGLEKQAHELATALIERGHQVLALSGRVAAGKAPTERVDGVEVHRMPWPNSRAVRWVVMPIMLWRRAHSLLRHVQVVHAHVFSGFGLYVILLARLYRRPVMVKLPNVGASGVPWLVRGVLGGLKKSIFASADAVVAMSSASVGELRAIRYDERRVLATPNGLRLREPAERGAVTARGICRFAFVGRLQEQKGLLDLAAAMRRVTDEQANIKIEVHLYGEGPQRAEVEERVHALGLAAHVTLRGHVDDVQQVLSGYDAFVLPSYREGNSNAILEAMAVGLPIISTRVGGTPMLVGKDGADLLHEPGDVEGLARLMRLVAEDPKLRAAKGDAMRQRVLECFDIRRVAATYEAAYRALIEGRRDEIHLLSNPIVLEGT